MIFNKLKIHGAYLIELERREDERGYFARAFCAKEFATQNLVTTFPQINVSHNNKKGTIRGLHYLTASHQETKVIRCIQGEIYDVIVDLRPESPTYLQWEGITISAEKGSIVYMPAGCANGYQALADNSRAFYMSSIPYAPNFEKGIRYNDSTFNIIWPITDNIIISDKDRNLPDF